MKTSARNQTCDINSGYSDTYLPILTDIMEMDQGFLLVEISSSGKGYRIILEKSGKIKRPVKISLYINECIIETFILDKDRSIDLTALPPGSYRLSVEESRSFSFKLFK